MSKKKATVKKLEPVIDDAPKSEYIEHMESFESKAEKKAIESSIEKSDYKDHPKFAKFKK